jgi:hypothetical protein
VKFNATQLFVLWDVNTLNLFLVIVVHHVRAANIMDINMSMNRPSSIHLTHAVLANAW